MKNNFQFPFKKPPNHWSKWHNRLHNHLKANPSLLPSGKPLLISLSGGQDSMALTGLLLDLQKLHKWKLYVWHGDHNWHNKSSTFAKEIKEWCKEKHLDLFITSGAIKETKNESLARSWRYESLKNTAKLISQTNNMEPCLHILTGHTSSDRTETFLLNLSRGTDLAGLGSMSSSRSLEENPIFLKTKLIRPMLCFSREETGTICSDMELPIWIDPSNKNMNLSRNKIRHKVIPILEELYPGCSLRIASLSERIRNYKKDQNSLIQLALNSLRNKKGLYRKGIINLTKSARGNIVSFWLKENSVTHLSSLQIEEISLAIGPRKKPGRRDLGEGWIIKWDRDSIELENQTTI